MSHNVSCHCGIFIQISALIRHLIACYVQNTSYRMQLVCSITEIQPVEHCGVVCTNFPCSDRPTHINNM